MSFLSKFARAAVKHLKLLGAAITKRAAKEQKVQKPQRGSDVAEQTIYESERRYRILVQSTSDIITLKDADGTVHYESSALERVMGYRPEDQVGTNAFDWIHPHYMDRALSIFAEVLRTLGLHPPIEFRAIVVTSRDITKRKELEEQLRHQPFHDSLTGLPNRALFMERLEHALTRTRGGEGSVAVLFIDLDNFKLVNDSLGHEVEVVVYALCRVPPVLGC